MEISVNKCGNRKSVCINGVNIDGVHDYKIISSADGTTELIVSIKVNADIANYNLLTN